MNRDNDSLTEKADAAFRPAARKVIERARQTGKPVILWAAGRVIERTAEELQGPRAREARTTRTRKGRNSG
jgi:hypothetical protein